MSEVTVGINLVGDAEKPEYAREGDAGLDLRSCMSFEIKPGDRMLVPVGIKVSIPEGYAGLVVPRSGLAVREGLTVLNAPGLIDSGYRGEVCVIMYNAGENPVRVGKGDKVAQLVIIEVPKVRWGAFDAKATERGEGGFGSTGA